MDERDIARIERLIKARVPRSFIEASFREELQKLKKSLEQNGADIPGKLKNSLKNYLTKEYVHGVPPDIRGRKWSYAGAQELISEYWDKVKRYADEKPSYREELESLLMEDIDHIKFKSNYEVSLVVSLKSDPFSLRATKLPLLATLMKIAIERGDIGQKKKEGAKILKRILDWYLSNVEIVNTEELYRTLLKAFKQEQTGDTKGGKE